MRAATRGIEMNYVVPEEKQFEAFLRSGGDGEPVALCHLLKFRENADYTNHPSEEPCSGKVAYHRYLDQAVAYIEAHGGSVVFNGDVRGLLIGPESESWDEVLLVQFPNVETVTEMMSSQRYQDIGHHRLAGLADTRLLTASDAVAT
jgi:uncharacterized protein (DUF1330 family)